MLHFSFQTGAAVLILSLVLAPHVDTFSLISDSKLAPCQRINLRNSEQRVQTHRTSFPTRVYMTPVGREEEKLLRAEIAEKNSLVEHEELYGVADREVLTEETSPTSSSSAYLSRLSSDAEGSTATAFAADEKTETSTSTITATGVGAIPESSILVKEDEGPKDIVSPLRKKIQRATKPRAYPLFLAEKAAQILEDTIESITGVGPSVGLEVGSASTVTAANGEGVNGSTKESERIVVLGTGWGATAFLKEIDTDRFDVTVISPRNFFLFTPMLAGASVGTVEYRSITEPVREINNKANFLEATAVAIDPKTNVVSCESVVCEGNSCTIEDFTVDYDRLILTVGAQTSTFGIPGVREYCCFLKQVEDARRIRTAIVNCFERANIPSLTDEQREAILTFAVIGAGPTGVEFASELRDFIEQDGPKYYPKLLKHVRIKVIEASSTVLAPFDRSLQEEAIKQLTRHVSIKDPAISALLPEQFKLTELLLDSGVSEVKKNVICLNNGKEVPYGVAVWAAGNGPLPITLNLIEALGSEGEQGKAQSVARGRIAIDPWLRVLDGEGKIFAFGDCSCILDGALPATAQVASQQGEYLARLMTQSYNLSSGVDKVEGVILPPLRDQSRKMTISEKISAFAIQSDEFAPPFQFLNLGILAYTGGGSALAQLEVTPDGKGRVKGRGKIGFGLWRSVYLSKQISWRNRFLVFVDWTKAQLFGRDITRV